jgi:eukaryotic-like serine/threonine-protein kinase
MEQVSRAGMQVGGAWHVFLGLHRSAASGRRAGGGGRCTLMTATPKLAQPHKPAPTPHQIGGHPNVVRLIEHWRDAAGQHHTVLEYADGSTVGTYAAERVRDHSWSLATVASVLADVAEGLAFVHARGFVHRDVKPAKMLVVKRGARALLSGFDAACRASEAEVAAPGVGTLLYMAPEVLCGAACTAASDVWSLGVAAFELLASNATTQPWPFVPGGSLPRSEEPDAARLLDRIRGAAAHGPQLAALRMDAAASPRMCSLLNRMLEADPAARPTAVRVVEELEAVVRDAGGAV